MSHSFLRANSTTFRILSVFLLALMLIFFFFLFSEKKREPFQKKMPQQKEMEDISIILHDIHQITSKEGIKQWRLNAVQAILSEDRNHMTFDRPMIEFFRSDGSVLYLKAEKGSLARETSNMHIEGNVRIDLGHYVMTTDALRYEHATQTISTDDAVRISGMNFEMRADTMRFNLSNEQTFFDGHVKGALDDQILP